MRKSRFFKGFDDDDAPVRRKAKAAMKTGYRYLPKSHKRALGETFAKAKQSVIKELIDNGRMRRIMENATSDEELDHVLTELTKIYLGRKN